MRLEVFILRRFSGSTRSTTALRRMTGYNGARLGVSNGDDIGRVGSSGRRRVRVIVDGLTPNRRDVRMRAEVLERIEVEEIREIRPIGDTINSNSVEMKHQMASSVVRTKDATASIIFTDRLLECRPNRIIEMCNRIQNRTSRIPPICTIRLSVDTLRRRDE